MDMESKHSNKFLQTLSRCSTSFGSLSLILLFLVLLLSLGEFVYNSFLHQSPKPFMVSLGAAWLNDIAIWVKYYFLFWIFYALLYLFSEKYSKNVFIIIFSLLTVNQILLIKYFSEALIPLGADILGYSKDEIIQTLGSAGAFSISSLIVLVLSVVAIVFVYNRFYSKLKPSFYISYLLPAISFLYLVTGLPGSFYNTQFNSDFTNNLVVNKSQFFYSDLAQHYFPENIETDIYDEGYLGVYSNNDQQRTVPFKYIDNKNFPFLHSDTAANVLSPFFKKANSHPNVVIILVEGLGRAFSNEDAYLGSFTPFLDSLSSKSLYFPNFLSSGGRTFAALPSILGSLPFAKNGFLELGNNAPTHLSLISILKKAGYHTSFYYGGDASFDKMNVFLRRNKIDEVNDISTFPSGYTKLPASNGFTWGYNDKELYRLFLNKHSNNRTAPFLSLLLTVSSHSPFLINEQDKYFKIFEDRLNKLGFDAERKKEYQAYKYQYTSILYTDDAIRSFINNYRKSKDFENTIFLITGDHRMPEIPMSNKIDRYHVPFIIYSPLLKRTAKIESVSSHFDIAPSLITFLSHTYGIKQPQVGAWMGSGLDTARACRNIHSFPLMQTKTALVDFVAGNYHLNNNTIYEISNNMQEEAIQDKDALNRINTSFNDFKNRNNSILTQKSLIPDSIYNSFYPKK